MKPVQGSSIDLFIDHGWVRRLAQIAQVICLTLVFSSPSLVSADSFSPSGCINRALQKLFKEPLPIVHEPDGYSEKLKPIRDAVEQKVASSVGYAPEVKFIKNKSISVSDRQGVPVAFFNYSLSRDLTTIKVNLVYVSAAFRGKGISEYMFAKILEKNPSVRRAETILSNDNKKEFLKHGGSLSNCVEPMLQTPAAKMRIKFGFNKVIKADCKKMVLVMER